jgi:protein-tyrosine phosphatase
MGVFRRVVQSAGLADRFEIDSAGTSSYHLGAPPDPRTVAVAKRRGVTLEHAARQISRDDLSSFSYIVVMDESNYTKVQRVADAARPGTRILRLRDFDPEANGARDVPDPYFGGERGFEDVHDMVERACQALLEHIRAEEGL